MGCFLNHRRHTQNHRRHEKHHCQKTQDNTFCQHESHIKSDIKLHKTQNDKSDDRRQTAGENGV